MFSLFKAQNGVLPHADKPVGLVAGRGELPRLLAETIHKQGNPLVVAGIEGDPKSSLKAHAKAYSNFKLNEVTHILDFLKQNKVRHLLLAGGVPKRELFDSGYESDVLAKRISQTAGTGGDARLLKAVFALLKINGIQVLKPASILKDECTPPGVFSHRQPTREEWADIAFGKQVAKSLGKLDIGQTVIVRKLCVLAVEALEGTDRTIDRVKELGLRDAVVVKCAKPGQDLRLDMPVVGPNTVERAAQAGCSVIAVEAGKSLFLNKNKAQTIAQEKQLCLVGI